MKRNIWIWNHYATNMIEDKAGRHYSLAKNLILNGYKPTIFCASTLHNSNRSIEIEGNVYTQKESENVPFVVVKTPQYSNNGKQRVINMISFYKNLFPTAKNYAKLNGKPDIIIASSVHPLTLVAGIKIAKRFGVPCICEVRDLWPESFVAYGLISKKNPLLRLLYAGEKWIYKNADKLIFTMEGGRDYIIEKGWNTEKGGPININKVNHINNGVDLETFTKNLVEYTFEDSELDSDSYKIVYTGSLRQTNDSLWVLLKTAKLLQKNNKDVKIIIYGNGTEKRRFMDYCEENSIDNVFFKGYVDKKFIPYILSKSNLNILNCSSWSVLDFGSSQNKLFDYFASGKPIISGEDSKYSIIKRNGCGISRKIEGPEDLYNIILYMMNLKIETKEKMSEVILKTSKEYDYKNLTNRLIDVIEH